MKYKVKTYILIVFAMTLQLFAGGMAVCAETEQDIVLSEAETAALTETAPDMDVYPVQDPEGIAQESDAYIAQEEDEEDFFEEYAEDSYDGDLFMTDPESGEEDAFFSDESLTGSTEIEEEEVTVSGKETADEELLFDEISAEDLFEEETDADTSASVEAGDDEEDLTEEFVLEDPLVVNMDGAAGSSSARGRRLMAAAAPGTFTSYGDQLSEDARKLYDFRKDYYVTKRNIGTVVDASRTPRQYEAEPLKFKPDTTIYTFTVPLTESGSMNRNSEEYIAAYGAILEICQSAADAFQYDYPQMFWTRSATYAVAYAKVAGSLTEGADGTSYQTYYVSKITYKANEAYDGASGQVAAFDQAVSGVSQMIRASSDYDLDGEVTDNELIQGIHDYICERCWYDRATLNSYRTNKSSFTAYNIFSAAGVFMDEVSTGIVCEGYSRGFKVLCDTMGIPCACVGGAVSSDTMGHMWNHVCLDDVWYLLDSTWDDSSSGGWGYSYFLIPMDSKRSPNGYLSGPSNSQKMSTGVTVTFASKLFAFPVVNSDQHAYSVPYPDGSLCTGYTEYACSNEDGIRYWVKDASVDAPAGHSIVEDPAVPETCIQDGHTTGSHCETCGKIFVKPDVIPADENLHQWGEWEEKSAASCETAQILKRVCANCGSEETKEGEAALGHDYGDWEILTPAGCEEEGTRIRFCSRVSSHTEQETIPASGHDWDMDNGGILREATCSKTGIVVYRCKKDPSHVLAADIPATEHSWGEWQTKTAASCTEAEVLERVCTVCGEAETTEGQPAHGHEWGEPVYLWSDQYASVMAVRVCTHDSTHMETELSGTTAKVTKEPTCMERGETTYRSSEFADPAFTVQEKTVDNIAPLGHSWGGWTVTKAATTQAEGEERRVCANDASHVETRIISRLPAETENKTSDNTSGSGSSQGGGAAGNGSSQEGSASGNGSSQGGSAAGNGSSQGGSTSGNGTSKGGSAEEMEASQGGSPADTTPSQADSETVLLENLEETLLTQTGHYDVPGSTYKDLKVRASKVKKKSVTLSWKRVKNADSYVVYGTRCLKNRSFKKLKTVTGTKYTQKKLKSGRYYKYVVAAVRNGEVLAVSKTVYAVTRGGSRSNPKKVTAAKASVTVRKKKTVKLRAELIKSGKMKSYRKLSYESSDPSVAKVTSKGKVKGIRKGTCVIYVYAQNGLAKRIKVRVK